MFVEHRIITGMLEVSNEFQFLQLICIKGLRETEQYVEIMRHVENARVETPLSFNKY